MYQLLINADRLKLYARPIDERLILSNETKSAVVLPVGLVLRLALAIYIALPQRKGLFTSLGRMPPNARPQVSQLLDG